MEQSVEVGSASIAITFASRRRVPNGAVELLDVTIRDVDLEAGKSVYDGYADGFEGLAAFFEGMAESWRGWSGERTYESTEHDLRLVATHDGHVRLRVRLWQSADPDGWMLETVVRLEAGEQLGRAAAEISALVRG